MYTSKIHPTKTCPFCGSQGETYLTWPVWVNGGRLIETYVICSLCKAQGPIIHVPGNLGFIEAENMGIDRWNRRDSMAS